MRPVYLYIPTSPLKLGGGNNKNTVRGHQLGLPTAVLRRLVGDVCAPTYLFGKCNTVLAEVPVTELFLLPLAQQPPILPLPFR